MTSSERTALQTSAVSAVEAAACRDEDEATQLRRENEALKRTLAEAWEQQTAISQVLRVISESPTDVAPVLEVILDCATRLVQPELLSIFRYDGRLIHIAAKRNWPPEMTEEAGALFPMPADERSIVGR